MGQGGSGARQEWGKAGVEWGKAGVVLGGKAGVRHGRSGWETNEERGGVPCIRGAW